MAGRLHNGEKKLEEQEFQQELFREYMHCPKAGCTVCPSKGPYAWAACTSCSTSSLVRRKFMGLSSGPQPLSVMERKGQESTHSLYSLCTAF